MSASIPGLQRGRTVKILAACLVTLLCASTAARADVLKMTASTDAGPRVYWWPALPIPKGWVHDDAESREREVNVLLPAGQEFAESPAVIYARADSKSALPQVRSVADYIRQEKADIRSQAPTADIVDRPDVKTADGATLKVVAYAVPAKRHWELVAYGEEGDFYLVFTASASSASDLKDNEGVFYGLLAAYRKRL